MMYWIQFALITSLYVSSNVAGYCEGKGMEKKSKVWEYLAMAALIALLFTIHKSN